METFSKLRLELDELGYTQTLKPECVPLVGKLLGDLKTTTESLCKYMKISQQAIEERDNLALGAEPYKCDNAKLIRECNELHLAFIQFKEKQLKIEEDLKSQINTLETELKLCNTDRQKLKKSVADLEIQLVGTRRKGDKIKSVIETSITSGSRICEKGKHFQLNSSMALADQKTASLTRELNKLKEEQSTCTKSNEFLKKQLQSRDDEIRRLNGLLEGGRPVEALSKDCCYKNVDNKIGTLQDEINALKFENNSLKNQLKETIAKQHEAMRRALHLAERNKELEKEMRDIDQIALEVEAECNTKVRHNVEKVQRLQDKINESITTIESLERDNSRMKQEKMELFADLEAIKLEKKRLQTILEQEKDDKKRLTDRINTFSVIEKDLNLEIDRLLRVTGEQKRQIAELEYQLTADNGLHSAGDVPIKQRNLTHSPPSFVDLTKSPTKSKKPLPEKIFKSKSDHKKTCKKASSTTQNVTQKRIKETQESVPPLMLAKCCCEAGGCLKNMKELLDKEMEYRQVQAVQQIESLRQEKEYYMKEYHKLADEMRNVPTHDSSADKLQEHYEDLLKTLHEKNRIISELQRDVKVLSREKNTLMSQTEQRNSYVTEIVDGPCQNITCKRKHRELEVHREEMKYLEKENNELKEKIKTLNQSTVFDQERMKKAFQDMEEHIRKLENERRELVVSQCTDRSNMSQLEEECHVLKEKLRVVQTDLNNQKANYNQLKMLHEQTDRALTDAQNKLLRAETEVQELHSRMQSSHRESSVYEKELAKLQGDIEVMKKHLSKIDKEKDELLNIVDEKTEKIDKLETQLQEKNGAITNLEHELKELKRKLR